MSLTPGAFGIPILKAVLEDIAYMERADLYEIGSARPKIDSSFEFENAISSSDLTLINADSQLNVILPVEKGIFGVSVHRNNSQFRASYSGGGIDLSAQSDIVNVLYGIQLTPYLDLGVGLNQYRNDSLDQGQNLGYSYEIKISPSEIFSIGYGSEKNYTGIQARIEHDNARYEYPAFGTISQQRIDLSTSFDLNQNIKFSGLLGRKNLDQNVNMYDDEHRVAYLMNDQVNLFGKLGFAWQLRGIGFSLDVSRSSIDLASRGSLFAENLPDMLSNIDNIDKAADLKAQIATNGLHLGISGPLSERVAFTTKFSYLSMLFEGDANIWNSWFFGAVRQLEGNYVSPFKRVNFIVGDLGLKYKLHEELEINYAFKQLIPVSVEGAEESGDSRGGDIGGGTSSGGNTQMVSMTYYF